MFYTTRKKTEDLQESNNAQCVYLQSVICVLSMTTLIVFIYKPTKLGLIPVGDLYKP